MILRSACRIAVCGALSLSPHPLRSPCAGSSPAHRWEYRHSSSVGTRTWKRCFPRGLLLATPQQQQQHHARNQREPTSLDPSPSVEGEGGRKETRGLEDGALGSRADAINVQSAAGSSHDEESQSTTTITTAKNRAGRAVNQEEGGLSGTGSSDSARSSPPPPPPTPTPTAPLKAPDQASPPLDVLYQDQNFG